MQQNVERRQAGLREKLPEMKGTLMVVRFLRKKRKAALEEKKALTSNGSAEGVEDLDLEDGDEGSKKLNVQEIETTFSLQDTLYAKAKLRPADLDEVYLWLGANVMVAYPLEEAEVLLQGKVDRARESLKAAEEDLEFLRVQITTLEVAIARVHNWDVGEKRRLRVEGKAVDGEKGGEAKALGEGEDGD